MRLRRPIWFLTLLALVLYASAPRAGAAWQCEGRACGTTPWVCCCESPNATHEESCRAVAPPEASTPICTEDCGCELALSPSTTALVANTERGGGLISSTVCLRVPLPIVAPPPVTATAPRIESRAPLRPPLAFVSPSLRAPPIA